MRRYALVAVAVFLVSAAVPATAAAEPSARVRIGMDVGAIPALTAAGAKPDLAMFWLGSWNGNDPYGPAAKWFKDSKAAGVTPVVQWFYWGDSISPSCVQNGCDGRSQSQWTNAGKRIAQAAKDTMGGAEVLVVVEPEFNKNGVESWETWDGLWVAHAKIFHGVPGVKVVLSFGNWGQDKWSNFDRAVAEADLLGFQTMRGSTKSSYDSYMGAADAIAAAAKNIRDRFGRESVLTDLALSSYPEPDYARNQEKVLSEILARTDEYYDIGLRGIVYRSLKDSPNMGLHNHFGIAERHWGLWKADGTHKAAWGAWKAYAQGAPPAPPPAKPTLSVPGTLEAETMVASTGARSNDPAASGGAAWNLWADGSLAGTLKAPGGAIEIVVRARGQPLGGVDAAMELVVDGAVARSWSVPPGFADYTAKVDVPAGDRSLAVRFTNDARSSTEDRNLIVDKLDARKAAAAPGAAALSSPLSAADVVAPAKVRATYGVKNVGGSSFTETFGLAANGAWTAGPTFTLAPGETRTVSMDLALPPGEHALEARMGAAGAERVPGDGGEATVKITAPPFSATFRPKPGNEWWIEVVVDANTPVASVSATIDGGSSKALTLRSWGAWAGSHKAPAGAKVVFQATSASGEKATSGAYRWPDATPWKEPAAFAWAKEAESAAKRSTGGVHEDAAASGGKAWNLWANGHVADSFQAPASGAYTVTVVAKGTPLAGKQAAFDLVVDGKVIGSFTATSSYASYAKTTTLGAGWHEVRVVFKNDAKGGGEDRNLIVDRLAAKAG